MCHQALFETLKLDGYLAYQFHFLEQIPSRVFRFAPARPTWMCTAYTTLSLESVFLINLKTPFSPPMSCFPQSQAFPNLGLLPTWAYIASKKFPRKRTWDNVCSKCIYLFYLDRQRILNFQLFSFCLIKASFLVCSSVAEKSEAILFLLPFLVWCSGIPQWSALADLFTSMVPRALSASQCLSICSEKSSWIIFLAWIFLLFSYALSLELLLFKYLPSGLFL